MSFGFGKMQILILLLIVGAALLYRYVFMEKMSERGILITKIVAVVVAASVLIGTGFVVFNNSDTEADSWQAQVMQYDDLHNLSRGENVVIALIDSGVSSSQLDMKNVVEKVSDGDLDINGHGTMMCSLIVGDVDGVAGIAPDATVYSYMVVDNEDGKVDSEKLYEAINQAINDKVDIINISLGSFKENEKVRTAIEAALSEGIIVVSSAGDYEAADMLFPANMDGVISVGALDKEGQPWSSNNATDECTIVVPGVDIPTIDNTGIISATSGTSQASSIC